MFLRSKKNRSGTTSVVVVDKSRGAFKEIRTIGVSSDPDELIRFKVEGRKWIENQLGIRDIFVENQKEVEEKYIYDHLFSNIDQILLNGSQFIIEKVFTSIGFDRVSDDILKFLVLARLSHPMSKAGTVEYLKSHFDQDIGLHKIYRYLDKLYNSQQELIQKISVDHTRKILGNNIGLLFYDVTTLYFEANQGDDFREGGFSKDGKHSNPQVVLGLLVSKDGYPLSYSIFGGSQYEGRTMLPLVEDFISRFKLEDFVIVADSGLLNGTNITLFESFGYKYIIGARIKNESNSIKKWILSLEKVDGELNEYPKAANTRLIIGYSEKRASKDRYNREKGIKRLEKQFKKGSITKENINKRGYNKFLEITSDVKVKINQEKIEEDKKWDGLKGYITNTSLPAKQVYEQYRGLWIIENAFRLTKGKLEIRPIFHFTERRIEAHVCICFVAYKVYKELERILKLNGVGISVEKVLNIAKTIATIKLKLPKSKETITRTMFLTPQQKSISKLYEEEFWKNH